MHSLALAIFKISAKMSVAPSQSIGRSTKTDTHAHVVQILALILQQVSVAHSGAHFRAQL